MPIGTSDGNYYESEFDMHISASPKAKSMDAIALTRPYEPNSLEAQSGIPDLPLEGPGGKGPGPDTAEPADVVEKHWKGLFANWRSIADKIDPKRWEEWKKTGPFSKNIEDRREEEPDLNLLMQVPLDELPGILARLKKTE